MKLIHTGDLHIGKTMSDFSLIPDQRFILDQLLAAAREEKADAFVIAGDVYDRAVPPRRGGTASGQLPDLPAGGRNSRAVNQRQS